MEESTNATIRGIEQGRAKCAYGYAEKGRDLGGGQKIRNGKMEDSSEAKEYKAYVRKIPMMIKTNGLGASLAFIKSKHKKIAYQTIYKQLTQWLAEECNVTRNLFVGKSSELVEVVIDMKSHEYRAVTLETLAILAWLGRFAEGLIQGEAEGDDL